MAPGTLPTENKSSLRQVRICRPAFQDMHHLVMPRLSARAELRRFAVKLACWTRGAEQVADHGCFRIDGEDLYVLEVSDGFGLADGFFVVFCEASAEPNSVLCVLSVMRNDEPFSPNTLEILRGRRTIAMERLGVHS